MGHAGYFKDGKAAFGFASPKQYIALYVMKTGVHAKNAEPLKGLGCG